MLNKLKAFTVIELIISTCIMALVLIITPLILLKRNVKPARKHDNIAIVTCEDKCIYSVNESAVYPVNFDSSKNKYGKGSPIIVYDYNKGTSFYTIELIGGGGAATGSSNGYAGGIKSINIPTLYKTDTVGGILTGCYLLDAGHGGTKDDPATSSTICAVDCSILQSDLSDSVSCYDNSFHPVILAQASGGISGNTSNSSIAVEEYEEDSIYLPAMNYKKNNCTTTTDELSCTYGTGGKIGSSSVDGQNGVIIIK